MPVTNVKSVWSSGNLIFRSTTINPTAVPVMQFGQSDYPVQSKFHCRPATAGNVVEVRSRPSAATGAAHAAIDSTLDWRPTSDAAISGASYARAVQGVARIDRSISLTSSAAVSLIGLYGQCALNETATANGNLFMTAIYGLIEDGGTYTEVNHVAPLWLDSHLAQTVTAGKTSFAYISNNGATTFDQVFYIYGGDKISKFATFDTCGTMVADATGQTMTVTKKIAIDVGGSTLYLQAGTMA